MCRGMSGCVTLCWVAFLRVVSVLVICVVLLCVLNHQLVFGPHSLPAHELDCRPKSAANLFFLLYALSNCIVETTSKQSYSTKFFSAKYLKVTAYKKRSLIQARKSQGFRIALLPFLLAQPGNQYRNEPTDGGTVPMDISNWLSHWSFSTEARLEQIPCPQKTQTSFKACGGFEHVPIIVLLGRQALSVCLFIVFFCSIGLFSADSSELR